MAVQIAAQLYTLREQLKTEADIAATLKKVRELGYEAVQVSGLGPIDPKELKRICDGEGLAVCATHESPKALTENTAAVAEKLALWNCRQTAYPYLAEAARSEEGYKQLAKDLTAAGKKLAAAGITLSYHNHGFEFERYGERIGLEILYEESDPKFLKAEIDTYWVQYGGGDPAAWCRRMKGRMPLVHLKDMTVVENKPTFAEVGAGNLNWPAILDACREAGTRWYIVEQDLCRGDPLDSLRLSLENLKKMGL